jgi:hypothetical protein
MDDKTAEQLRSKVDVLRFVGDSQFLLKSLGIFCDLDGIDVDGDTAFNRAASLIGDAEDIYPALADVILCGNRVLRAFRALGESGKAIFGRPGQIAECEAAMVAFDAALARIVFPQDLIHVRN